MLCRDEDEYDHDDYDHAHRADDRPCDRLAIARVFREVDEADDEPWDDQEAGQHGPYSGQI